MEQQQIYLPAEALLAECGSALGSCSCSVCSAVWSSSIPCGTQEEERRQGSELESVGARECIGLLPAARLCPVEIKRKARLVGVAGDFVAAAGTTLAKWGRGVSPGGGGGKSGSRSGQGALRLAAVDFLGGGRR